MTTPCPRQPYLTGPLEAFRESLAGDNAIADLRAGLVGKTAKIDGPFGVKNLVYADYVANQMAQPDYDTMLAAAQAAVDVP